MDKVNLSSSPECFPISAGLCLMPTNRFFCIFCGTVLEGNSDSRADVVVCPSCAHHVPVPRLADIPAGSDGCGPVFPPEVLELSLKFLCTGCRSPLRADARWEGLSIACPACHEKIMIPRWSRVTRWPRSADADKKIQNSATSGVVRLSADEIDFLSTTGTGKPGANA